MIAAGADRDPRISRASRYAGSRTNWPATSAGTAPIPTPQRRWPPRYQPTRAPRCGCIPARSWAWGRRPGAAASWPVSIRPGGGPGRPIPACRSPFTWPSAAVPRSCVRAGQQTQARHSQHAAPVVSAAGLPPAIAAAVTGGPGKKVEARVTSPLPLLGDLAAWATAANLDLPDLQVFRPTLEDVYLQLTRESR